MELKSTRKDWEFILYSVEHGEEVLKYNPLEWRDTEYGMKREEYGMSFTFSGNYTFVKDGYHYLRKGLNLFGILWVCTLTIKRYDNHSGKYITVLPAKKLDFTHILEESSNGNSISVPLVESDFIEAITARRGDAIPYGRLKTLAGKDIAKFDDEYIPVKIYGQEVETKGYATGDDNGYSFNPNGSSIFVIVLPFDVKSDNGSYNETAFSVEEYTNPSPFLVKIDSDMFFKARTKSNVHIQFSVSIGITNYQTHQQTLRLMQYTFDKITEKYINPVEIFSYSTSISVFPIVSINKKVDVLKDTALSLEFIPPPAYTGSDLITLKSDSVLNMGVISKDEPMIIQHISLFNLHTRMIEAITGIPNAFKSSVFGPGGKWENVFVSNGYLYRRFPTDTYTGEDIDKERLSAQLAFKLPDLTNDMRHILGVGYGIIFERGQYKVICEDESYFFKNKVGVVVNGIEMESFARELDIEFFASTITVGTDKKDFEQESGLLCFHTKTEYSTILSIVDNDFDLMSKTQVEGYWHEFCRRLSYFPSHPDPEDPEHNISIEDSPYDNDNCLMEVIWSDAEGMYVQRGTEDFTEVTGLGVITTPINLNLVPARCMFRWGNRINIGLAKYPPELYKESLIRFNKSEVLTSLTTTRKDDPLFPLESGVKIYENTSVKASDLPPSSRTGKIIKVRADISYELVEYLRANPYTLVDIPNPLKLDDEVKYQEQDDVEPARIQGWVKLATTKPIFDTLTNLELYEAVELQETGGAMIWNDKIPIQWVTDEDNINWNT